MIFHSKKEAQEWANQIVNSIASRVSKNFPKSFVDQDDLSQSGWLAFSKCVRRKSIHTEDFRPYAYVSIKRAIHKEKLRSLGILCVPLSMQKSWVTACIKLRYGKPLPKILKSLCLSTKDWVQLKSMFSNYLQLNHDVLQGDETLGFDLILSEILNIQTLTDDERCAVLEKIGKYSPTNKFSRTKTWRLIKSVETKLERCGYV